MIKKRKGKVKRGRSVGGKTAIERLRLPKPIERRVLMETNDPSDVRIIRATPNDPVVVVKGKTVGAWLDL